MEKGGEFVYCIQYNNHVLLPLCRSVIFGQLLGEILPSLANEGKNFAIAGNKTSCSGSHINYTLNTFISVSSFLQHEYNENCR